MTVLPKASTSLSKTLNDGLARFADASFDTVVMARAPQAVKEPDQLLLDMVRVGKEGLSLSLILRIGKTVFTWVSKA